MEEYSEPSLEEIQADLDAEVLAWQAAGLSLNNMQMHEAAPLLFDLQIRVQALTNALLIHDAFSEEELNYQYKRIMLNDMRALREAAPEQEREAIRQQILSAAQIRYGNGIQKPPWER